MMNSDSYVAIEFKISEKIMNLNSPSQSISDDIMWSQLIPAHQIFKKNQSQINPTVKVSVTKLVAPMIVVVQQFKKLR